MILVFSVCRMKNFQFICSIIKINSQCVSNEMMYIIGEEDFSASDIGFL